jgi:exopolysaccharide biosynthesis polyprenyl glycosylphosphotransferase
MNRTTMTELIRLRPPLTQPTESLGDLSKAGWLGGHWRLLRFTVHATLLLVAAAMARLALPAAGASVSGGPIVWLLPPLALVALAARGAYRPSLQLDVSEELLRAITATAAAMIGLIAAAAIFEHESNPAPLLISAWGLSALYLCASAPILTSVERRARRSGAGSAAVLIVGAGQVGTKIERRLTEQPELGLRVIGYVDADPVPGERVPDRQAPVLGAPDEFAEIAERTGAEHVILTFTSAPDRTLMPLIRACEDRGLHVWLVPRMFESVNLRISQDNIGPLPILGLRWVDPKGWQFAVKHAMDRALCAVLLFVLSPLLIAIATAVRLSSPGPILFRQRRIGRDGQRFEMLKFRSMRVDEEHDPADWVKPGVAPGGVEGADRRTPIGRLLRRYSLDELPQLINVLRGEMSLIGPRPERPDFVEVFDERVRRYSDRHRVKSGITGLAQINGFRGQTSLPERVELDNYYIQNWSMGLDVKILMRTFGAVMTPAE